MHTTPLEDWELDLIPLNQEVESPSCHSRCPARYYGGLHTEECLDLGHPTPKLDNLMNSGSIFDDGPGTISVTMKFTDGAEETVHGVFLPTKGEAVVYRDGLLLFETPGGERAYSVPNVRFWFTEAE